MTTVHPRTSANLVPTAALGAPALLLLYGLLRLVDGLDGHRGPGWAWNLGHTFFLVAFVLFAVLLVGLRRLLRAAAPRQRALTMVATTLGLAGAAGFLWVILGDLFPRLSDAAPLPDPAMALGPLLFQVGILTLLVQAATTRPRLLPAWSPALVLLGFLPIAVNLDLLPLGAALILVGLLPLHRLTEHHPAERDTGESS
ncbi:hypothetical protein GA0070609_4802 [Micromonospora echinaurantiaca]|uniref:Low temperature requirement A protein (LtrA) n=1 Tax=Micromonospora echinaurantiaca TaxID=47857 RepID=A0A1C5JSW6_9ACTN|nr:hypothetical protein [Micromonospora echinaurantiaca]SCG73126.1 hypothetical protein GA0070609_4802 [Micromonospora echinaurantiaca]